MGIGSMAEPILASMSWTDWGKVAVKAAAKLGLTVPATVTCTPPIPCPTPPSMARHTAQVFVEYQGNGVALEVPVAVALDLVLRYEHPGPRQFVLLQPTLTDLTTGEPVMAAYALGLDKVAHFVITEKDAVGTLVPVDPADVFTVVSADPVNLQAVIDKNAAGQTTVSVNWLHTTSPMLTGVGIALTDSAGNTADNAEMFDMVPPAFVPAQLGIDIAGVVETSQPVPT